MTKNELANLEPFERLQHREWERQQLLDELKREIDNLETWSIPGDSTIFRNLAIGTIAVLLGREIALEPWPENRGAYGVVFASLPEASSLFENVLMPKIRFFTRSKAEQNLIKADLLEDLISRFNQDIRSEFLRVTVHERKQFFETIGYPTNGCN